MDVENGKGGAIRRNQSGTRLRRFCFTLNNWTEEEWDALTEFQCTWMVMGKEVGENGTRHLQGMQTGGFAGFAVNATLTTLILVFLAVVSSQILIN